MTRGLLFGSTSGNQNHSKYLVEFRAGRMTRKGNMVHPDKRKGTVYVHQSEDSLMHFCWKDRTTGSVEDDLIIFPDDAEFKKVTQCTTGRVYVLKFKSSSRRCFYWMQGFLIDVGVETWHLGVGCPVSAAQEPKEDKDDELVRKVNEYLNNPPVPGSSRGTGSSGAGGSGSHLHSELPNIGDDDLQNLLNNMSQTQLVQLLGGIGGVGGVANLTSLLGGGRSGGSQSGTPTSGGAASAEAASATTATAPSQSTAASSTATATATTDTAAAAVAASTPATTAGNSSGSAAASGPAIQLSDLQSILSGIKVPPSESAGAEASKEQSSVNVDLSAAINVEVLQPLLDNKELMSRVEKLLPATTESGKQPDVSEHLQDTIKSPQFQQALSMFSTALQSGQLGPLMQQFGMDDSVVAAANSGDMAQFVKALQASKGAKDTKSPKKDENIDEDMGLD